jgi:D-alanyl-D-alanine carboxypeptidase
MRDFYITAACLSVCALGVMGFFAMSETAASTATGSKRFTASLFEAVHPKQQVVVRQEPKISISSDDLTAQAALVYDPMRGKVLFSKNGDMQLPLASITKLMTAVTVLEHTKPSDTIVITHDALSREGDSGLILGEQWDPRSLVAYTLMTSSNDGAAALAEHLGRIGDPYIPSIEARARAITLMNERAKELQMSQTYFVDETGLDIDLQDAGAYGSASDVARLVAYIVKKDPTLLDATEVMHQTYTSKSGIVHYGTNTNEAIPQIPGLIGGKTGFTDLAGGNLVVVFDRDIGNPLVVVVLGSTKEGRFEDVVKLVNCSIGNN